MVDNLKVERAVESLCQNGCAAVSATITAMELDIDSVPLNDLAEAERKMVLEELKSIMSVYDQPCEVKF